MKFNIFRLPSIVKNGRTRGNSNPAISIEAKIVSAIVSRRQNHDFVASSFNVSEDYVDKCCFDAAVKLVNDNKRGQTTIDDISTLYKVDNTMFRNEIEDIAIRRFNLSRDDPEHLSERNVEVVLGIGHTSFRRMINNLANGLSKHHARDSGRPSALSQENQIKAFGPYSSTSSKFNHPTRAEVQNIMSAALAEQNNVLY